MDLAQELSMVFESALGALQSEEDGDASAALDNYHLARTRVRCANAALLPCRVAAEPSPQAH